MAIFIRITVNKVKLLILKYYIRNFRVWLKRKMFHVLIPLPNKKVFKKNHCNIAKRCSKYISSVVEVSSCSYRKTVLTFVKLSCQNLCFWVLLELMFEFYHNISLQKRCDKSFWVMLHYEVLSFCYMSFHNSSFWVLSQFKFFSFVTIWCFDIFLAKKDNFL